VAVVHVWANPSALVVLVGALLWQGSMVYATLLDMQILEMGLWVTVNMSDMNPKSINTATTPMHKMKISKLIHIKFLSTYIDTLEIG
jgi:hypothetical protein